MENYLNPDNREFRVIANTYGISMKKLIQVSGKYAPGTNLF